MSAVIPMEQSYGDVIQRILDIMEADSTISQAVEEFRFGELPEEHNANRYPVCYVTIPRDPEVSRTPIGPAYDRDTRPPLRIVTDYLVVFVVEEPSPDLAQKRLYTLRSAAVDALESNMRLAVPGGGGTGLAGTLSVTTMGRLIRQRGRAVDGITLVVRITSFKESPGV